jgi:hypothetical protein
LLESLDLFWTEPGCPSSSDLLLRDAGEVLGGKVVDGTPPSERLPFKYEPVEKKMKIQFGFINHSGFSILFQVF